VGSEWVRSGFKRLISFDLVQFVILVHCEMVNGWLKSWETTSCGGFGLHSILTPGSEINSGGRHNETGIGRLSTSPDLGRESFDCDSDRHEPRPPRDTQTSFGEAIMRRSLVVRVLLATLRQLEEGIGPWDASRSMRIDEITAKLDETGYYDTYHHERNDEDRADPEPTRGRNEGQQRLAVAVPRPRRPYAIAEHRERRRWPHLNEVSRWVHNVRRGEGNRVGGA
jgi:hypothetical protein